MAKKSQEPGVVPRKFVILADTKPEISLKPLVEDCFWEPPTKTFPYATREIQGIAVNLERIEKNTKLVISIPEGTYTLKEIGRVLAIVADDLAMVGLIDK